MLELPVLVVEPSPEWCEAFRRCDEARPADAAEIPSPELAVLRCPVIRDYANAVEIGKVRAMGLTEVRARLMVLKFV